MRSRIRLVAALAAMACAAPATADDIYSGLQTPHTSWSLFAGATYTDDATLAPGGPSDTIAMGGVGLDLYRDTGRLQADIDGSVRYEDYLHGTYPGHVLGSLVGKASYAMVPERLNWVITDSYGQLGANTLQPTTPGNRINVNSVSTGPDGDINFGGATDLTLGARYSQSDFQQNSLAPQASTRSVTGRLGLVDHLTAASSLSANLAYARVQYVANGIPGYDQYDAFGRYDNRSGRGGLSLDIGASEIKQAGRTNHNPLLRFTAFHRLTPSWNINLSLASQYQNTGQGFASALQGERAVNGQVAPSNPGNPGQPTAGIANLTLGQAPFRSDSANVAFDFVRPRTQINVGGGYSRNTYPFTTGTLNLKTSQAGASLTRRLRDSLSFLINATYVSQSPTAALAGNHTTSESAGLQWRAGALLALTLTVSHTDRASTSGANGVSFIQNMVYLGLTYGPPKPVIQFDALGQGQGAAPPH